MAVKRLAAPQPLLGDESGQSMIEMLFMLPLVTLVVVLVYRANAAIQMSIVNQKFVRGQALYVAMNSPTYPDLSARRTGNKSMEKKGFQGFVVGMSDSVGEADGKIIPTAQGAPFARPGRPVRISDCNDPDPSERSAVCLKTTIEICTQINAVQAGTAVLSYPDGLQENMQSTLGASLCRSAYEQ